MAPDARLCARRSTHAVRLQTGFDVADQHDRPLGNGRLLFRRAVTRLHNASTKSSSTFFRWSTSSSRQPTLLRIMSSERCRPSISTIRESRPRAVSSRPRCGRFGSAPPIPGNWPGPWTSRPAHITRVWTAGQGRSGDCPLSVPATTVCSDSGTDRPPVCGACVHFFLVPDRELVAPSTE